VRRLDIHSKRKMPTIGSTNDFPTKKGLRRWLQETGSAPEVRKLPISASKSVPSAQLHMEVHG